MFAYSLVFNVAMDDDIRFLSINSRFDKVDFESYVLFLINQGYFVVTNLGLSLKCHREF